MTSEPTEIGDFWAFSLRFYDDAPTQAACLALQDQSGADVNVALYLLFRAASGDCLDSDAVAAVDQAVVLWRSDIVQPLRALRRQLKQHTYAVDQAGQAQLRNIIKKAELESEKLEQFHLESLSIPASETLPVDEAARKNLRHYGRCVAAPIQEDALEVLVGRLQAI